MDTVSVKDFGAVGDGVADDTAALLSGIGSNRCLVVPAGTYLISAALYKSGLSNFRISGAGAGLTIIKCIGAATVTNSALAFASCSMFSIDGITFDQDNNASFGATYPLAILLSCTDFAVDRCEFLHWTYSGLAINSCQRWDVSRNRIERDVAINTTTHAINVSSSVTTSSTGDITRNRVKNAGILVTGKNINIDRNFANGSKYGGGVVTSGNGTITYGNYRVTNNTCVNGTGLDVDGTYVCGMELAGWYVLVDGNICYNNGGTGIALLTYRAVVTNNTCYGNGQMTGGASAQVGIQVAYGGSEAYSASRCVFAGNICYDGGSGKQLYGIYEESGVAYNTYGSNQLLGNVTGEIRLIGTQPSYHGRSLEGSAAWTPGTVVNGGSAGVVISVPGAALGDYVVAAHSVSIASTILSAYVNAADSVIAVINNQTGASQTIGAGTVRARVLKPGI
jgi:hypothetical protein